MAKWRRFKAYYNQMFFDHHEGVSKKWYYLLGESEEELRAMMPNHELKYIDRMEEMPLGHFDGYRLDASTDSRMTWYRENRYIEPARIPSKVK